MDAGGSVRAVALKAAGSFIDDPVEDGKTAMDVVVEATGPTRTVAVEAGRIFVVAKIGPDGSFGAIGVFTVSDKAEGIVDAECIRVVSVAVIGTIAVGLDWAEVFGPVKVL